MPVVGRNKILSIGLVLAVTFVLGNVHAQIQTNYFDSASVLKLETDFSKQYYNLKQIAPSEQIPQTSFGMTDNPTSINFRAAQHTSFVSASNYVENLPLFCKLEVQADAKTNIPVRVRLGTVQYVDQLENKYQGYDWVNFNQSSMLDYISTLR